MARTFAIVPRLLFEKAMKNGLYFYGPNLNLKILRAADGPTRVAFVVPKAVAPKSVDRHLIKRRGLAAVREILGPKPTKATLIFFVKKSLRDRSYKNLSNEAKRLLVRANLTLSQQSRSD